jgi:hypothetical protein
MQSQTGILPGLSVYAFGKPFAGAHDKPVLERYHKLVEDPTAITSSFCARLCSQRRATRTMERIARKLAV